MGKKLASWFLVGFLLLPACGGRTANPVQTYQYGDENKSCNILRMEMSQIQAEIGRKISDKEDTTGKNVALGVTGVFFIVPFFFMDLSDADKIEIEALRNRYNSLSLMVAEKKCGFSPQKIVIGNPEAIQQKAEKETKEKSDNKAKVTNTHTLAVMPVYGDVDGKTLSAASRELFEGASEACNNINNIKVIQANGPTQIGSLYDWGKQNSVQAILICKYTEDLNEGSMGEKAYRADLTLLDVGSFSREDYSLIITYGYMGNTAQPIVTRMAKDAVKNYLEAKTIKRID